jgi:hypothetical protein
MNVVAFKSRQDEESGHWRHDELQQLVGIFAAHAAKGDAGDWATGLTEAGDPQFYLLDTAGKQDCLLCVSRLGREYILEDGQGHVICENDDLARVAETANRMSFGSGFGIAARLGLVWVALRHHYEEKIEPLFAEPMELLTHFFPQLAVLV